MGFRSQGHQRFRRGYFKDGRLVYARGFGYADIGKKQPVTPKSLFRIASISKPITAVAILQLVEKKELSLDDKEQGYDTLGGFLLTRFSRLPNPGEWREDGKRRAD